MMTRVQSPVPQVHKGIVYPLGPNASPEQVSRWYALILGGHRTMSNSREEVIDLREGLARRMQHLVESSPFGHGTPWEMEGNVGRTTYLRVADECIRQMEWARSECYDKVGGAAEDSLESISNLKLTIAPEDWKP